MINKSLERLKNEFQTLKDLLRDKKLEYIDNLDCYTRYKYKLCDKYDLDNINSLSEINYVDYEKLISLRNCVHHCRDELERAYRSLYNFEILYVEYINDFGVIINHIPKEELDNRYVPTKRPYKASKTKL